MKILQINKFYPFEENCGAGKEPSRPYSFGGTEAAMLDTARLLKEHGHEVISFAMKHPDGLKSQFSDYFIPYIDFDRGGFIEKLKIAANTLYSSEARKRLGRLLDDYPADIAHLNNFHHQLSPSILFELKRRNVPAVMTMHDYKLACPSYRMLNHGRICELCKGGKFYNSFRTRCHKDSFAKSLVVTLEGYLHNDILNSYKSIKYYICPSSFLMNKAQEMGLEGNFVKIPNFVDASRFKPYAGKGRDIKNGVYWGRLSEEKGLGTLLDAVKGLPVNITIIGGGPLRGKLEERIRQEEIGNVRLLGSMCGEEFLSAVSKNAFSILPSEWYENNPISIIEAFALGMPVIGARIGGIPELVREGTTGLLFESGNANELSDNISWLCDNAGKAAQMAVNARAVAEKEYNPEVYYQRLMDVYNKALGNR